MEQDAVSGQRALHHNPARRRIHPKPSARGGGGLVVDADRDLDHVAHSIADFQIGVSRHRAEQEANDGDGHGNQGRPKMSRDV